MAEAGTNAALSCDVLIIGGGPVGMTLALALGGSEHKVIVIDRAARGAWAKDPRALAIAHGSRQLLEKLGAWDARAATPICEIHVSQRGGFGRTLMRASDYEIAALGYVVRYRDLVGGLDRRLAERQTIVQGEVEAIASGSDSVTVTALVAGLRQTIAAKLVVHAEGAPPGTGATSEDPAAARIRDYRQQAVIAEVTPAAVSDPARAHRYRAWERFSPEGPLALLPLGDRYAMVFTARPERAAELLRLNDREFLAAVQHQFGERIEFVAAGPRVSIPLALRLRKTITSGREVWIGNTAQTLHPVSGQGLNLGLRDAWELAEVLTGRAGDGQGEGKEQFDAGAAPLLAAYARGRRFDRIGSMAFTDGIVRLFSNDLPPLRCARGIGLLALDLYPPLRHFVAKRMLWGARAWP